ncbi:hypothetical protein R4Z10_01770 [Niallia sp. XMNu-256]|uniref:hypothetical protein n=1 Tax=Niallia sp. XMNu-256 TaxID=3082444 RepID=UPI0030CD4744
MCNNNNKSPIEKKEKATDKIEGQEFVDEIPLEDLKIEMEDEKNKSKTKDDSQSERKYKGNVDE